MIFMFINLDATIYIRSKYLNESLVKIKKNVRYLHYETNFSNILTTSIAQAVE